MLIDDLTWNVSIWTISSLAFIPTLPIIYVAKCHKRYLRLVGVVSMLCYIYFNFFVYCPISFMNYVSRATWFVALMRGTDFVFFTPLELVDKYSYTELLGRLFIAEAKPLREVGEYEERHPKMKAGQDVEWTGFITRFLPKQLCTSFSKAALALACQYLAWNGFIAYFRKYPYREIQPDETRAFLKFSFQAYWENYLYAYTFYLTLNMVHTVIYGVVFCPLLEQPYKPIFNAPFLATSPSDFWSHRWNMMVKDNFHHLIFKPLLLYLRGDTAPKPSEKASDPPSDSKQTIPPHQGEMKLRKSPATVADTAQPTTATPTRPRIKRRHLAIASFATFLFSGILHEYTIVGCYRDQPITFEQILFFLMNYGLVAVQQLLETFVFKRNLSSFPKLIMIPLQTLLLLYVSPFFLNPFMRQRMEMNFGIPTLF